MDSFPQRLRTLTSGLSPGYFSMVMATGILSLAAGHLGIPVLPGALLALNVLLFVFICGLALLHLRWHPAQLRADLFDHLRAPGFFTFVAACAVLASQFLLLVDHLPLALAFGAVGFAAWLVFTYGIFTVLTVKRDKPPLQEGIDGSWLLAVVATQAMAVVATLLASRFPQPVRLHLNFFALSMWSWGGMLYIWTMALIFYRYTFFRLSPADLSPPYWINMGAMAISTMAGALLVQEAGHAPFLAALLPFLRGFTVLYWATGTWWIPMLLALGVWRHAVRRYPYRYDPLYWSAVFPLGMYAEATLRMSDALDLPFLHAVPRLSFAAGMAAWVVLVVGQARSLHRQWRDGPRDRPG